MEQFLMFSEQVTTIAVMLLSVMRVIVFVLLIILCIKLGRTMTHVNNIAKSIQEFTEIPLQVVSTLVQKFMQ